MKGASKELIANCYSASLPDEDFDSRLKDVLIATVPDQVHDLYKNAFVVQSIRQVALTQTAGFSSLIRTLKTSELLAEAAQVRQQAIDNARTEERALAESELSEQLKARQFEIARKASGQIARVILAIITLVAVAFILRDYGLLGPAPKDRSHLAAIILAGVTIYGALDVFGVLPAASVREKLRSAIFLGITRVQTAIT